MGTKHQMVIEYIKNLNIDDKISVRKISSELKVSEGTAYRAIKEAENRNYVKTLPRVGTVRIKTADKGDIDSLSYAEVASIVDGEILGGKSGLHKMLTRFVIGAMTVDEMKPYLAPGNLLIVGNRTDAQKLALNSDSAVLITGGFDCTEEIRILAEKNELPIISSSYDTFTTAATIERAISERLIKKDILLAEDIMHTGPIALNETDRVTRWRDMMNATTHSRFPVIDGRGYVTGIITGRDVSTKGADPKEILRNVMTKNPIKVTSGTTVAYVAHLMIWEDIELLPVVDDDKLIGVLSRSDVIKALQLMHNQPHLGQTLEDMAMDNFVSSVKDGVTTYTGKISPVLLSQIGAASWNAISMLISTAATQVLRQIRGVDIALDNMMIYYLKPAELNDEITIKVEVLDKSRYLTKARIEVNKVDDCVARAMVSSRSIKS